MSDTQKLLPCPHCEGEVGLSRTNFYVPLHAVKCPHCQHAHATREAAIAAWNRRATPQGDKTLREALEQSQAAIAEALEAAVREGVTVNWLHLQAALLLAHERNEAALDRAALAKAEGMTAPSAPEAPG